MESAESLDQRLAAEVAAVKSKVRSIQEEAKQAYEQRRIRFRKFLKVARSIRRLIQQKLVVLSHRIPMEARPAIMHSDHHYNATVTCRVPSEFAQVKMSYALSHDTSVENATLEYLLDILPVYLQFKPREQLVVPIDSYDAQKVSQWLDDRIVDFAKVYLQIPLTEPYQREHMVLDPIARINFPKNFARMTLKYDGKTYYFISDETCWEFERKHGIGMT